VTFADLRWIAGGDSETTALSFAGGDVDGIREVIGGAPRFTVGQRVVVFARNERSVSPIVGFHQGCFAVARGADGFFVTTADGRPVEGVDGDRVRLGARAAPVESGMSVEAFVEEIESRLSRAENGS
jgi:hypothetical protein